MVHGSIFLTEYSLINMARRWRKGMDKRNLRKVSKWADHMVSTYKGACLDPLGATAKYIERTLDFILEGSTIVPHAELGLHYMIVPQAGDKSNSKLFCGKFNGENMEIDLSEAPAVDTKTIGEMDIVTTKILASSTTDISEDAATHPGLHVTGENMEIDLSEALGKTNKEIESHRDAKAPDRSLNDADCSNMDTARDFNVSKSQHMDSTPKYLINNTEIASESIVNVPVEIIDIADTKLQATETKQNAKNVSEILDSDEIQEIDILHIGKDTDNKAAIAHDFNIQTSQNMKDNDYKILEECYMTVDLAEDRLEKTMEDVELEKGFEEKQGVQESKSSKETNKDKVCTDLHRRTTAENDLIVALLLKTNRQITKWHENAQDLYKSENGQKTRSTWEPGIIWMEFTHLYPFRAKFC